ncbi:hypothetical protein MSI_04640 [Treponema sp. JC4]|uniref:hypothetical protein n=1 Tax=Treponema sp. JC4 TaxID=1124982 RepID=UPI00025B0265|nr:hypothetical protein [Treponema sp. JC4]EID86032.1 hypothetical protein MSI_04640 [Treponema sp. JC4]
MKKCILMISGLLLVLGLYAVQNKTELRQPPKGMPPKDFADGELPPPPDGLPPEGMSGEFGHIPDEKEPELTATITVSGEEKTIRSGEYTCEEADKSVLLAENRAKVSVSDSSFYKNAGDSSNGGQSNFFGLNAAVIAKGKSSLSLKNVNITSDADGSNAVFATGEGTVIEAENLKIRTKQNSSRGLDATYGGKILAKNVDIETQGAHSAAFATDRGEGDVIINGGIAVTNGEGSPVIYSTGNICVKNIEGQANGSEIAVIEGKNSILVENSKLSGGTRKEESKHLKEASKAIMLYQSMSGDADQGTSVFTAKDSRLTSTSDGAFFYITNTQGIINLENTVIENPGDVLLQAEGNESERGWGRKGNNGGMVTVNTKNQILNGDIFADEISFVILNFGEGSEYTGSINKMIKSTHVNLKLDKKATVNLTADSYVEVFENGDKKCTNIVSNGHTLYYNKKSPDNKWLKGKTIKLKDGGEIRGI